MLIFDEGSGFGVGSHLNGLVTVVESPNDPTHPLGSLASREGTDRTTIPREISLDLGKAVAENELLRKKGLQVV